jgi:hypothetical protein
MNQHFVKTSVVMILSSVLLYYSVAWAVLRCLHDEDRAGTETAVSYAGLHQSDFFTSPLNDPKADVDCMGSNYHTETLAGSSSPSQLNILTIDITSHVNGFLTLHGVAEAATESLSRTAVFNRGFTRTFPTDSPRYLSLSVLRI